jgi:hypothetical protein
MRVGCILLLLVGAPILALAEESLEQQSRQHYDAGNRAYTVADYKVAIDEFKLAYNIKPDSAFLYNIAQSYRLQAKEEKKAADGASDLEQAILFYKNYLATLPVKKATAQRRSEVENGIQLLETQQKELAVKAKAEEQPLPPPILAPPPPPPEKPRRVGLWVGIGVAAVVVIAAVALGLGFGLSGTDWSAAGRAACTTGGCLLFDSSSGLR